MSARQVNGFSHEVSSHLKVAGAVAHGLADTGPGIMAVAQALGLDFSPCRKNAMISSFRWNS